MPSQQQPPTSSDTDSTAATSSLVRSTLPFARARGGLCCLQSLFQQRRPTVAVNAVTSSLPPGLDVQCSLAASPPPQGAPAQPSIRPRTMSDSLAALAALCALQQWRPPRTAPRVAASTSWLLCAAHTPHRSQLLYEFQPSVSYCTACCATSLRNAASCVADRRSADSSSDRSWKGSPCSNIRAAMRATSSGAMNCRCTRGSQRTSTRRGSGLPM
jgi:hypothetical protein